MTMTYDSVLSATQRTSITSEVTFLKDGVDWKIGLRPDQIAHLMVKVDFPSTPTDVAIIAIYASNIDAPGAVPTAGTLAASDWSLYQEITLDKDTEDDEWNEVLVSGPRWFAVTVRRSGTTDTLTDADLKVSIGGP